MTITQYSRKRKRPHDVFDILHATRIDGRPDIACWISECPPPSHPKLTSIAAR